MRRARLIAVLLLVVVPRGVALRADTAGTPPGPGRNVPAWTALGAGAGFGLGFWFGFQRFNGAVYAERKIWTTAALSAAAGGTIAFFLARRGGGTAPHRASSPARLRFRSLESHAGDLPVPAFETGSRRLTLARLKAAAAAGGDALDGPDSR